MHYLLYVYTLIGKMKDFSRSHAATDTRCGSISKTMEDGVVVAIDREFVTSATQIREF